MQTVATSGTSGALVESVDIFPALAELAGLPPPPLCVSDTDKSAVCVEGVSLAPLVSTPDAVWKGAAFSQYPR